MELESSKCWKLHLTSFFDEFGPFHMYNWHTTIFSLVANVSSLYNVKAIVACLLFVWFVNT